KYVTDFYRAHAPARVQARDLRLYVTKRDELGRVTGVDRREEGAAVEIDLGSESLLTEQTQSSPRYRVSDYDPRRTEAFHHDGHHRYVLHRSVLAADVVLSLSKLKTHEKVGITCGLKGFVGAVAHKDCLAHHRFGSPRDGGDEYPDHLRLLRVESTVHDW